MRCVGWNMGWIGGTLSFGAKRPPPPSDPVWSIAAGTLAPPSSLGVGLFASPRGRALPPARPRPTGWASSGIACDYRRPRPRGSASGNERILAVMTERARADRIREMFDRIASGYDRQNTLFSLDRDRAWRRRAARLADLRPGSVALDLCTGTGKLAAELVPYVR